MKIRIVILSFFMLAAAAAIAYASRPEITPIRQSLSGLPLRLDGWEGRRLSDSSQKILNVLGVDDHIHMSYSRRNSPSVSLYIGYFQSQKTGKTIHSPLNCLPGAGWIPVRNEHASIPVNGGRVIEVNRITIQKGEASQVVIYWYHSQGRVVASEYMGKIYAVLDAMRTNRTDAALVRIISSIPANAPLKAAAEDAAEKAAIEFTQALFPTLADFLPD
jgi:EpsI family protein